MSKLIRKFKYRKEVLDTSNKNIRLVERDYTIFKEIARWRVITAKHIRELANFNSQSTCDRRLQKLREHKYIDKKYILHDIPALLFLTHKSKVLINASKHIDKIKIEQIHHDLIVLDTAIYFHNKYNISYADMTTEKELHSYDGFSLRKHRPDFIFFQNDKNICVEVELSLKNKDRFLNNIKENFLNYDTQIWIVEDRKSMIASFLFNQQSSFTNLQILDLKEVKLIEFS